MLFSGDRKVDYASLEKTIAKAITGFAKLGLRPGSAVALMLRNDIAFFEAAAAINGAGANTVPINWHLKAAEAGHILRDSGASALVCHRDLLPQIAGEVPRGLPTFIVETPPEIARAYNTGPAPNIDQIESLPWSEWVQTHQPSEAPQGRGGSMIYTSGTTGTPKGVVRPRPGPAQLAAMDRVSAITYGLKPDDDIVVLMNGPMYHSAPYSYAMLAFRHRCSIVLQPRFEPEDLLRLIEKHRVTHMHMVPTMFVRLLRLPDEARRRYDLSSLRFVVHGAAPCPPEVKQAMIRWWGPVINEYYGSTETGIPVWHSSEEALRKPGTVGRVIEGGIVRIFDPEGRALPPGEIGEIYVRQTALLDFTYHGNAAARAEVGREGLVTVGDVGYLDEDGYLFLSDRKRDMVISGGVNIYPAEIEAVLITMPGVRDCAVFGIPDEEYGERLCACIEAETGSSIDAAAVQEFIGTRLANYKVPRLVRFLDALPREDSGKIFKRRLREPYWQGRTRQT
ncbi:MAG: AMP-binding protein [Hyphomicrobiaceae bacterium]|nr:MAG: AMP-binding protein [Hyphomicrobiaceae bacterium]